MFLFFGLWFFLIKRMAGQQPGFMTLRKNKAKIYMQEDIDVKFEDVAGENGVPFFSMSGSEFVEMFVGLGAARY